MLKRNIIIIYITVLKSRTSHSKSIIKAINYYPHKEILKPILSNRRNFLSFICSILFIFSIKVYGQQYQIISTSDGLPQSFVSGTVQDDSGFLWIATKNGIARYDGISYKLYQHNSTDNNSIGNEAIVCMKYFQHFIWIEYNSGNIDRLDPITEEVKHYNLKSAFEKAGIRLLKRGWIIGEDHLFWAISESNNLISYDFRTNRLIKHVPKSNEMAPVLWGINEDSNGVLWLVSRKELISYDKKKKFYKGYLLPVLTAYNINFIAGNTALDLHYSPTGDFFWGDTEKIYLYSHISHKIDVFQLPFRSRENIQWMETGPDGAQYFECSGKVMRYYNRRFSIINNVLADRSIEARSFFVDKTGVIWIGTNARGILKIDMNNPVFYPYSPADTFPDLLFKNEFNNSISGLFDWTYKDSEFSLPGYHIRSSYDKRGNLWVGMKTTVICYNSFTKTITKLPEVRSLKDEKSSGIGLKGITFNTMGLPIVAGYNGNLLYFDHKTSKWQWFIPQGALKRRFGDNFMISDIYADQQKLWITTESHGLICIDLQNKGISHVNLRSREPLLGIYKDIKNADILWIGGYQGLIGLNKKSFKTKTFTTREGLPDNTVYAIEDDSKGNLWISTNRGLCRFNPINHQVKIFKSQNGLQGNEFNRFHSLKLPDGRLSFGGPEGWVIFDPSKMQNDYYQPEVTFTHLKINNADVIPQKKGSVLDKPINAMVGISLDYYQNSFTISFAGMEFNQPQDIKYRYQLVGYDNGWIECGNIPFVNYKQIPPGDYEFRVNCSNTEGKWSNKIRTLRISVHAPWWRTWWAYLIYGTVIFIALGYWLYLLRVRIKLEESIAYKQKESEHLKQIADMKSRFFANVTHEFRTPLTLIISPLSELKESLAGTPQEKKIDTIYRNSEQLLDVVNQLLTLSKLEEDVSEEEESIGDLSDFTKSIIDQFCIEASHKKIELSFSSDLKGLYKFNSNKLKGILFNLIGNALKFTLKGGHINIQGKDDAPNGILFIIKDSGVGISEAEQPYIFNRYFQAENSIEGLAGQGTGIGLFLVQEFVNSQNGSIKMESKLGSGTTFTISLPYFAIEQSIPDIVQGIQEKDEIDLDNNEARPVILLVEDNDDMLDFIMDLLPNEYVFFTASNGETALKLAIEKIPDIIVTDIMMPVMDGLSLCRELRSDDRTNHIPIIILTAKDGLNNKLVGLGSGADDYLVKPFNPLDLVLRIQNSLSIQARQLKYLSEKLMRCSDTVNNQVVDPFLKKLYDLLESRLDDSGIGVEELASFLHIGRVQLHRKVKGITGKSSVEVIREYRLERSVDFLREGLTSSEAAYQVGFESPAYFSKCFKAHFKMTPSEFVKNNLS
ncbi:response regulator [Chryseobacterium sp.]|uniref:hybrid sensor histidine kinase/response regulator transcription factor n=1 Tax=Chryseobacterium sp. TaxID=1871047 RepID=UPI0032198059